MNGWRIRTTGDARSGTQQFRHGADALSEGVAGPCCRCSRGQNVRGCLLDVIIEHRPMLIGVARSVVGCAEPRGGRGPRRVSQADRAAGSRRHPPAARLCDRAMVRNASIDHFRRQNLESLYHAAEDDGLDVPVASAQRRSRRWRRDDAAPRVRRPRAVARAHAYGVRDGAPARANVAGRGARALNVSQNTRCISWSATPREALRRLPRGPRQRHARRAVRRLPRIPRGTPRAEFEPRRGRAAHEGGKLPSAQYASLQRLHRGASVQTGRTRPLDARAVRLYHRARNLRPSLQAPHEHRIRRRRTPADAPLTPLEGRVLGVLVQKGTPSPIPIRSRSTR